MPHAVSRPFALTFAIMIALVALVAVFDRSMVSSYNLRNILRWTGLFGLLSVGVSIVIMTGGIDLSVGSIVALVGALCVHFITVRGMAPWIVLVACIALSGLLGCVHGFFVAKVNVQPFVVTLCGLFVYRGVARFAMGDITLGYGSGYGALKLLASGTFPALLFAPERVPEVIARWSLPVPFVILLVVGLLLGGYLRNTIWGRYTVAIGSNEQAVLFSGVSPEPVKIGAYMISSVCAGLAGILFSLDLNSVQPSTAGIMYELYAIAGCVVGGVSLKGGEGAISRVIVGTGIVRILYNAINILGVSTTLESSIIGIVILFGVSAEELFRTRSRGPIPRR